MNRLVRLWHDTGIRPKLTALFLVLGIVPMAVLGVLAVRAASNSLEHDAERANEEIAAQAHELARQAETLQKAVAAFRL